VINFLSQKGINVYIDKDGINTLDRNGKVNTMGKLMISILGTLAEIELETFKERSKRGNRANVEQGGSGTGIIKPFGYKKVEKKLVVDDDEAKIVKLIFEKYVEGLGTVQIANHLNNCGYPTKYNKLFREKSIKTKHGIIKKGSKFEWKDGTVYGILTNTIYKGERKHKDEVFPIEKIIDPLIFDEVQLRLSNKYNKKGNNNKYENILKDIIKCGYCDYQYFMHKRANGNDKAYKCTSIRYHKNCGNSGIGIDKLNNAVYLIINHRVKKKFNMNEDKINEVAKATENLKIQLSNTVANIKKENNRLNVLLDMRLNNEVDKDAYHKKFEELQRQLELLKTSESKFKDGINNNKSLINKLRNTKLEDLVADINVFKKYVSQVIEAIKIYKIQHLGKLQDVFVKKQDNVLYIELQVIDGVTLPFIISSRTNDLYLLYDFDDAGNFNYFNCETKTFVGKFNKYIKFTIPKVVRI
jgi:DNA invertase Pin-like site-specific DNA recombinase